MVTQTRWTERTFDHHVQVGLLPCILERLRGTPARLESITRSLPASICTKRVENSWSIQEHAGHLLDLEELGERRLKDYLAGSEVLTPADMENRKTYAANHNANTMENILKVFRHERLAFAEKLGLLDETQAGRLAFHPRLKRQMQVVDWVYFIAEHDDNHLARIRQLIKTFMAP